jgi:hypothetical protein
MSMCVYCVCAVLCVQVTALRQADPPPRSPTDWLKDQETEKAAKVQPRAVDR